MNKQKRKAILQAGSFAMDVVSLDPDRYLPVLGSYLDNDTIFGRLIRWHQRGEASHSSVIFLEKLSNRPVLEIHALEGWGVIATKPGALARKGARVEMRRVETDRTSDEVLDVLCQYLGAKYEKPRGFVTKSRREDPTRWFCSELVDDVFDLQNCPSCFVSPPWARRSPKAAERIGEILIEDDKND